MQVGTLVKVRQNTLAGTCGVPWIGRVTEISSDSRHLTVSNGKHTARLLTRDEVEVIRELLPLR